MWKVFGSISDGSNTVFPIQHAKWQEWENLKILWSQDTRIPLQGPQYTGKSYVDFIKFWLQRHPMDENGYVWSDVANREWPWPWGRSAMHYDNNAKYILGAYKYLLWTGDTTFLEDSRDDKGIDYTLLLLKTKESGWNNNDVIWEDSQVRVNGTESYPGDGTIGQSFEASQEFYQVGGNFRASSSDSRMTLTLKRDGPTGAIVASKEFDGLSDSGWHFISFDNPRPPGKYYLEMSNQYHWIGWWPYMPEDIYNKGDGYINGEKVTLLGGLLIDRLRQAMQYQINHLEDDVFVINDGKATGRSGGMPVNYWDNLPFGYKSAYENIYFYASLEAMAEIEKSLGNNENHNYYKKIASLAKDSFNNHFWDEEKGRYIGCIDVDGKKHDFGFVFLSLEAIYYGLASDDQATEILKWIDGKRLVSGDNSQGDDIYNFIFAPRSNTKAIETESPKWWWNPQEGVGFGNQVQNGGAIFYTSFFDILDRIKYLGSDNAFGRFNKIMEEFHRDHLLRPSNNQQIGIINEFPESGLVPTVFLYGFLGIDASIDALEITPQLPNDLDYGGVNELVWRENLLRIKETKDSVEISCLDSCDSADKVRIHFKDADKNSSVTRNGVEYDNWTYDQENGVTTESGLGNFLFKVIPSSFPGDADRDGVVDGDDLNLLKQDYLGEPVNNTDFNSDGRVDSEDFAILQSNYQDN